MLNSGEIKGKCVHRTDRVRLVESLYSDLAMKQTGMARLFQCNEKTIREDFKKIRTANALRADPGFADEIAGEIPGLARSVVEHTLRVGRDKSTPPAVRVKAERSGMRTFIEGMNMLQSLGHLPSAGMWMKAEQDKAPEQPASLADLIPEIDRLISIAGTNSPSVLPFLKNLRDAADAVHPSTGSSRAKPKAGRRTDPAPPTEPMP